MKYKFKSQKHYEQFMSIVSGEIVEGYKEAQIVYDMLLDFSSDDVFELDFNAGDVVAINGVYPLEVGYFIMYSDEFKEFIEVVEDEKV